MGPIRILLGGLGGIAGFVAWYLLVSTFHLWPFIMNALYTNTPEAQKRLVFYCGSLLFFGFCAGASVLFACERLGLLPSREELDRRARPVSLLSEEDRDRRA
jgi:hypothetical protein